MVMQWSLVAKTPVVQVRVIGGILARFGQECLPDRFVTISRYPGA